MGRVALLEPWDTFLLLATALVLGLFSAALGLVFPTALGYLVDLVDEGSADTGAVVSTTAIMVAATGAGAIGSALTIVLATRAYQTILADLRERLLARSMGGSPQGLVERAGTGDLIARASDDVAQVADAAPQVIPALTASGFSILVTLAGADGTRLAVRHRHDRHYSDLLADGALVPVHRSTHLPCTTRCDGHPRTTHPGILART